MTGSDPQGQHRDIKGQLSPPDTAAETRTASQKRYGLLLTAAGFLILVIGSAAVLFLLPTQQIEPPETSRSALPQAVPSAEDQVAASADNPGRTKALKVQEEVLSLKIKAESEAITRWAETDYQAIRTTITRANEVLAEEKYPQATELYRQAAGDLQLLLDAKQERYQAAIEGGLQALSEANSQEAKRLFEQALAIDPLSTEAQEGIKRAASITAVAGLYQEAQALEKTGNLIEAAAKLENLLVLDKRYKPATVALERIQAELNKQSFQTKMNSLLKAIENKDLASARRSFASLKNLGIYQDQIDQAGKLLAEEEELVFIATHRQIADNQREAEQWQQALATYTTILAVAPDALFAVNGRTEATKRSELDSALSVAISSPHRLQDEKQRSAAAQLLAYARQVNPIGPRLESQIDTLEILLTKAGTPVTIILESDNETDITIYHVGRIGTFFSKQINLKPGSYTVVGSKLGYRDVRKTIEIGPGEAANRFFIRCEEPI